MFNFAKPKNPYRKKGKDYNLSENSKLTANDFAYSAKLASSIYKVFKSLQRESCKSDTFSRFKKVVYQTIRNDQEHMLGQLRLGYGSVSPLKGFRFSKKSNWQSFFLNYPTIYFDAQKGEVRIAIPPILIHDFNKFPSRISKIIMKMHCFQVAIDSENTIEFNSSKDLLLQQGDNMPSRSVVFSTKNKADVLLLCVGTLQTWLLSADGQEEFLSYNSSLMTAEIMDALLIRDGQLCSFAEERLDDLKPPILPVTNDEVDWI
ncbi:hypothetical protein LZQ00_17630 [Sphingobacterium sp. SRCM116780]|uniref:hypothetical protein n=1 Tax=Sphingobacterium sp. SRCM116780 TaxID=2907623 RepID=UPI001F3AF1CF|nr:hypothetical protein [Sphingobacterium sp. SRCM116780]UIR56071.1 hypothetical protein LZQ00_17630 [Sphingobacterium sp. SRCM116780]